MASVTGTVDKIDSRTVKTKFGPKPVYDVFVDGRKYGWGFKNPALVGVQPGVSVVFDVTENNGYYNADPDSLKINSGGGPAPRMAATSNKGSSMGFPVDTTSDKFAIIRQNALTNAVQAIAHYPALPTTLDLDEYVDTIIKVAYAFTDFSSGQREVKAARKLQRNHPKAIDSDLNAAVSHLISDEIEANNANNEGD